MGCGSQILHMILIIFIPILFLHPELLMAGAPLYPADNSDADGLREQYWTGDSVESPIKKVSGEDDNEEMKALILEKFRVLLGMKSFNLGSPTNGDVEHGLSSPSPAPTVEDEAPVVPIHVHFHPPSLRGRPIHPPHKVRRRNGDKDRVRRIVIVIVVSAGATLVISALGFILLFRKFGRCQLRRTSVSGSTDGRSRGRLKYVIPPNSTSKVSFDLSPEHFYLDSLGPVSEPEAASLKHTSDNVTISTNEYPSSSPMDEVGDTCEDLIKSKSDNVSSSAEEIISVHVEQNKCELDVGNCSSTDEIIHPESLSSDDESFHSFCGSRSSNVRLSSASERSLSEPSEVFSRLSFSEISSPLDQGFTEATLSSSMESPVAPVTPDLTPPLYSNLHSSPSNSPTNPKQRIPSLCSSNSQQNFPPPPPPPPPPANVSLLHFCAPQSLSAPTRTVSRSKIPKVSSPQDSDSSSQSKQTPSNDLPSSILHKPPQVSPTPLGGCGSIPPPPSPPLPPPLQPPFLKGHKNSHQPPPPPPCQLTRFTPVGKDGAPLPKLKPLHWDKVRATADRSMVWDKLRSSSFEFDEEMIESLFGYNLQSSIKNDEAKNKSLSPSKHVLEPKRLQNLTILSKALNATVEQVCDALLQGDGLCLQQLEALVKMVPTKEEEAKLSNYQGNINELGSAEKFVKVMLNIPFAFPRIEAMLYRETFEDEVVDLRKSFAMLEEACKELRSSRLFLKLLEAVLKTGNRMNVGTIRGGARAFKLDALLKLADVKGTDGKTTLLHFVVQEMIRSEGIRESEIIIKKTNQKLKNKATEEREEEYRRMGLDLVSGLSTELCNVKKTATIDLDVLASSVSNLSDGMVKLQHLLLKDLSINDQNGKFVLSMRYFLNYAEKCIKELQEDENRVLLQVRDITEYFHGDVSKEEANPLRIFVIVRDFLGMLDQVCNEVRSLKTQSIQNPVAPFR